MENGGLQIKEGQKGAFSSEWLYYLCFVNLSKLPQTCLQSENPSTKGTWPLAYPNGHVRTEPILILQFLLLPHPPNSFFSPSRNSYIKGLIILGRWMDVGILG